LVEAMNDGAYQPSMAVWQETEGRVMKMVCEEEDEVARLRTPGAAAKEQVRVQRRFH